MSRYVNYLLTGSAVNERPRQEELLAFQLQPNPVGRNRTLRILLRAGADGQIAIINTAGQTLYRRPVRGKETMLNTELPPGMYFVQLNSSSGTAMRSFVVTP